MRWVLSILVVAALAGSSAMADPDNLNNGVFIAHHAAQIQWSSDIPAEGSWHAHFRANYAITDCSGQVNEIPGTEEVKSLWFVLAAWTEAKVWAGIEFGIDYSDVAYGIYDHGPCFPANGLTIPSPDPTWPTPGSGIAAVVTDENWEGNFVPIYYFWGYNYGDGQIQIIADPNADPDFCGTANRFNVEFPIGPDSRGALGLGTTLGKAVCPPTIIPGACCFDGGNTCEVLLQSECIAMGGTFKGEDTVCDPNPCPTTWACCIGDFCFMLSEDECVNEQGGRWLVDQLCSGVVCADLHVCCLPGNSCVYLTEAECSGSGGAYVTDPLFQSCDPNPCPVAVEETSWGTIKSLYR